jgi:predicted nuclease with TOPRIM domain
MPLKDEHELEELTERVSKTLGRNVKYENIYDTVRDLLNMIDKQQQEYNTLYSSVEESDAIIAQLQDEVKRYQLQESLLLERLKKQTLQLKETKQNSRLIKFYEIAEENLKLAQENARLRELVKA